MSSEKQRSANQANAQKSTGPKTAEGKTNAKRNALKHGLTGDGSVLPVEDETLFKERLQLWTNDARPSCELEKYQIGAAVWATVKFDRAARNDMAESNRRRRRAIGHWEGVQTRKINKIVLGWDTDPASCVEQLEQFTRGCDWLLECWEELAQALETDGCWTGPHAATALRLLGKPPEMPHENDPEVASLRLSVLAAASELDPDEVDAFFGVNTEKMDPAARLAQAEARLPGRDESIEALWEVIGAALDRLAPLRAELWTGQDGPALSQKIDLATFDDSKAGELRRRYSSSASLEMHRSLKQLADQRRQSAQRRREGPGTSYESKPYNDEPEPQEADEQGGEGMGSEFMATSSDALPHNEAISQESTDAVTNTSVESPDEGLKPDGSSWPPALGPSESITGQEPDGTAPDPGPWPASDLEKPT
jgi:hypothetical protein